MTADTYLTSLLRRRRRAFLDAVVGLAGEKRHPPVTPCEYAVVSMELVATTSPLPFGGHFDVPNSMCTYENTSENIGLVLKGHHRSQTDSPGRSPSQQLRRSRSLSVTW